MLLSSGDEVIALQLVDGSLSGDPESRFYVERRGEYALEAREDWPPLPGGKPRVLVTMRASPPPPTGSLRVRT